MVHVPEEQIESQRVHGGSEMKPVDPIDVVGLFAEEREHLLHLLTSLSDDEWATPTVCPGWTVKDVVLHLLGVDLANLSRRRDGFQDTAQRPASDTQADLVAFLTAFNQSWVEATRRLSPRLLCELLAFSGPPLAAYYAGLDLGAMGEPVSWAGPQPAPVWLDVAREYTERWVHQQQIRDALQRPGLVEPRYCAPVLAAFVHGLPHALSRADAPEGTCVRLVISGPAGGAWLALRTDQGWVLAQDEETEAAATVTLDQATAWRLFTRGIPRDEAQRRAQIEGDATLASRVLDTVSIIA